jgi:hypothetical protein
LFPAEQEAEHFEDTQTVADEREFEVNHGFVV